MGSLRQGDPELGASAAFAMLRAWQHVVSTSLDVHGWCTNMCTISLAYSIIQVIITKLECSSCKLAALARDVVRVAWQTSCSSASLNKREKGI